MSEHFGWTEEARRLADHDQGCAGKPGNMIYS